MVSGFATMVTVLLSITPLDGGVLVPPQITINGQLGDQYDPHVDQDLAAYSSFVDPIGEQIRFYEFSTGLDRSIPNVQADGGTGRDFLSDVDQGRIVFTRIFNDGTSGILLFDVASNAVTELAPGPNTQRLGVALGAQTAAFIDYGLSGDGSGELMTLDLGGSGVARLTNDTVTDFNPAVSPDGTIITWERCPVSQANCDIYTSTRTGAGWSAPLALTTSLLNETNADTNGTQVVYERTGYGPTGTDLVIVPVAGGPETVLEIAGEQRQPSIRGQLVAFENRAVGATRSDIYVIDLVTNRLFQVTNTATVNETLNDVTVLPNGEVRLVWQANDGVDLLSNIYGATFVLPAAPAPDAGVADAGAPDAGAPDAGLPACTSSSVTLEATQTYSPKRSTDGQASFPTASSFVIPAVLPVVAGNAGNKSASLTFASGGRRIICTYRSGSSQPHPRTAAQLALAAQYSFAGCRDAAGCDDEGDDEAENEDEGGHGRHLGQTGASWSVGTVVSASSVTLHVIDGDNHQPMTRVRVSLAQVCATATHQYPLQAAGAPEGPDAAAGCSSSGGTLAPVLALLAFMALMLRRPAAIRLVVRREQRRVSS